MNKPPGRFKKTKRALLGSLERLGEAFNRLKARSSRFLDGKARRHRGVAVARSSLGDYGRHGMSTRANAFAFTSFLSLFPLLLLASAVLGFVLEGNPALQQELIDAIGELLPALGGSVDRMLESTISNRGLVGLIGLVGILWGGTAVMDAIGSAFGVIWETDQRPFLNRKALGIGVMLALGVMGAMTIGINVLSSHFLGTLFRQMGPTGETLIVLGGLLASLSLNFVIFITIYRVMPRKKAAWRILAVHSMLFAAVFLATEYAFNWYFVTMTDTQAIYGTIGTVIGILAWLRLTGTIVFLGGEAIHVSTILREADPPAGPDRHGDREALVRGAADTA